MKNHSKDAAASLAAAEKGVATDRASRLYLVTQYPKPNRRAGLISLHVIVEAMGKSDAIRQAIAIGSDGTDEKWFGPDPQYCAPKAKALKINQPFST